MYSKCMVEPLIRQPMAMTAEKGPLDAVGLLEVEDFAGVEVEEVSGLRRLTRSEAEAAMREGTVLADWTCPPAISLRQ